MAMAGEAEGILGGSHAREEHAAELAGVGATAGARGQQWLFIPSRSVLPQHAGTWHCWGVRATFFGCGSWVWVTAPTERGQGEGAEGAESFPKWRPTWGYWWVLYCSSLRFGEPRAPIALHTAV